MRCQHILAVAVGVKMPTDSPAEIIAELKRLTAESAKGPEAVYNAEVQMAEAEQVYDRELSLALLSSEGSIPEKQAKAKLAASDAKFAFDLARAGLNRVKLKVKQLESAQVASSVIAKLVEAEMRMTR